MGGGEGAKQKKEERLVELMMGAYRQGRLSGPLRLDGMILA